MIAVGPRSQHRHWLGSATVEGQVSDVPRARGDVDDLLARVGLGDRDSFDRLYDLMAPKVYGLSLKVLKDPAHAEEVSQEVLLQVWRHASRFDPARGTALGWIMTIAHRKAVDRVRSEHASRARLDKAMAMQPTVAPDGPAEGVMAHIERQRVRSALAKLSDLQRQAIELAYFGGYTYREVAELIDAPLGTVKTRMRDGLLKLREALGETR